ncbi:Tyrosine recombinase XerC [subsurface metagenome]|nr:tyrosine-type recombinase/integrase [Methanosarcinales archaeon]
MNAKAIEGERVEAKAELERDNKAFSEIKEVKLTLIGRGEKIRENRSRLIKLYCNWRERSPGELIEEAKRVGVKKTEHKLKEFYDWLRTDYVIPEKGGKRKGEKGLAPRSAGQVIEDVRVFYKENDIPIGNLHLPTPRKLKENFRKFLSAQDVKRMLDVCERLRDKVVILCAFQAGLGMKELITLNYGDVAEGLDKGEIPLTLHLMREKEGIEYYTFLGEDAVDTLRCYIKLRRKGSRYLSPEDIKNDSPLFISESNRRRSERVRAYEGGINRAMQAVALKVGLISEEEKGRTINTAGIHALRASFSTILRDQGVPVDYVEEMLGHRLPYDGAYMRATVNRLKETYVKAYPALSIKEVVVKPPQKEEIDERVKEYLARAGITNRMGSIYKCPFCGSNIDQNWNACPYCGSDVGITKCPKCNSTGSLSWKVCPYCKEKLKN